MMHLGAGRPSLSLPLRQIVIVVLVVVLGVVMLSFARILIVEYQLNLQKQSLETDIAELRQQNEQLRSEIDYLQSDAAIERLAREELGWTKPGETAVIVINGNATAPTASATATPDAPVKRDDGFYWWGRILEQIGLHR